MRVKPSPKQEAFIFIDSPVLLYRGAIASGKTVAGAARSIKRRLEYPGTVQLIGGPSWDQLRDGTMRTMRRMMSESWIAYENKVEHHWILKNGSEFIFRTLADPDVMRSLEAHDMWVDENAMCSPEVLDIGLGRLRLPAPAGFKHSWWGTTTPRAMDWTLDVFGEEGREGYGVVHSTIYDNKQNLPDGYIERLEEKYRDTPFFEQELLGMYTAFEGLVYPMFKRETHVKDPPCALHECATVGVGMDWGGTASPTAGVLVGDTASRHSHQYGEFYKVGATLADVVTWLDECCAQAKIKRNQLPVFCDTSEQTAINELCRLGFRAVGANKDRLAGIRLVAGKLNGETFTVGKTCVYTLTEYGQYIWAKKREGETNVVYRTNQPIDHHADAMDATRYRLMGGLMMGQFSQVTLPGGYRVGGR